MRKGMRRKYGKLGVERSILRIHKSMMSIREKRCLVIFGGLPYDMQRMPISCIWSRVRVKKKVWYLVTTEPVRTEEQAWEIVFAYKRRWQIELSFRYGKCELAMESPRLWAFENRLKLLGMVTLVYAFLLHLLNPVYQELLQSVLRLKCHRTGKRCREVLAPLYRLRWALSRLWDDYHPTLGSIFPPNLETIQVLASFRC